MWSKGLTSQSKFRIMRISGDAEKINAEEKYLDSMLVRIRCLVARHFFMPTVRSCHIIFFSHCVLSYQQFGPGAKYD